MREILKMTALRRIAPAMPGRRLIHANAPRDIIKRYIRYLNILAATVSGASIFVMVLVVAIDVVGRYVFNRPLRGGQELVEVTLVVAVLLSLGYTSMSERHVRMDLVVSRLGSRGRAIVGVSVSGLALVLFGLMVWQGIRMALLTYHGHLTTDILSISIFPFKLLVPVGAALLCLTLAMQILRLLDKRQPGSDS